MENGTYLVPRINSRRSLIEPIPTYRMLYSSDLTAEVSPVNCDKCVRNELMKVYDNGEEGAAARVTTHENVR